MFWGFGRERNYPVFGHKPFSLYINKRAVLSSPSGIETWGLRKINFMCTKIHEQVSFCTLSFDLYEVCKAKKVWSIENFLSGPGADFMNRPQSVLGLKSNTNW